MKLTPTGEPDVRKPQYGVRFEEREVEQVAYAYPKHSFEKVQSVSEWNELWYANCVSPWIRTLSNPFSAEMLKWLHPMRAGHALFSEKLNPWMLPLKMLVPAVRGARAPVDETNRFVAMEGKASGTISSVLDHYRRTRDAVSEHLFAKVYGGGDQADGQSSLAR